MASSCESWAKLKETRKRLEKCWETDINWSLYPSALKIGCEQVGKALNLPPTAVLAGYFILCSFAVSPASVKVPQTDWEEPVLLWLTVSMPTGSGKSTLFRHLYDLLRRMRTLAGVTDGDPSWIMDDATFEKMGALMQENSSRLLGFYDELSAFLTQINLYKGRNLSDSHELALFLQLFNGHPWRRDTVSGDANFVMSSTRLTIGGFTQAGVARSLIEMPSNSEKGLSHRFLWMFPKPLFGTFAALEEVNQGFTDEMSSLLAKQWRKSQPRTELPPRVFTLITRSHTFENYYDKVQEQLKLLSGMDELLAGMLSKSRGQILRLSAVIHVLFSLGNDEPQDDIISEDAVKAAIDFVHTACQQAAYIAGRSSLEEEILRFKDGKHDDIVSEDDATAAYCLTLPGETLYLTPLLTAKKFRNRGNKDGAVRAFAQLEGEGLGKAVVIEGTKGTTQQYEFIKTKIPDSIEKKAELIKKLQKYNISLMKYSGALQQKEIKPTSPLSSRKRHLSNPEPESPRRSPKKPKTPETSPEK